jgi:trimeric autotransporter adhesin
VVERTFKTTLFLGLALFTAYSTPAFSAPSLPENFVVEGKLYDTSGAAIAAAVDIQLEVYAEGAPGCVLYREVHSNVNVDSTVNNNNDGVFAVKLGAGTSKPGVFSSSSLASVFANSAAVQGDSNGDNAYDCSRSTAQLTSAARLVRVSVRLTSLGGAYDALSPDTTITSVPSAMVAETLQGRDASGFVQTRDDASYDLNQANVESIFSVANFAKLTELLAGNQGGGTVTNVGTPSAGTDAVNKNYADANVGGRVADVSTVGPATGNGFTLIWDQAQNRWVAGSPVVNDTTKLALTGGTMTGAIAMGAQNITNIGHMTMAAQRTLNLGTYTNAQESSLVAGLGAVDKGKIWFNSDTNVFRVWNGSAAITLDGALSGAAGGDLTGTYPNPTIAADAVDTAELANDAVTSAKINNTGIAVNRLLITDAATGATVTYKTCAVGESLRWTATGWDCASAATLLGNSGVTAATYGSANQVAQFSVDAQGRLTSAANVAISYPVVSVAGKTGAVSLVYSDVAGLGSAATKNFGTAVGDLVEVQSSGRLPAIDGSMLTNVTASYLQGRAIAGTTPTDAQLLTWNAANSSWEPRTASAITSLLATDGTNAAPSIAFLNSTGTGFYRQSANVIGVTVNSADAWRFSGNGFVSATNFGPNLNPGTTASLPAYTFLGDPDVGMYRPAADNLAFSTAATERMRIDGTGNLGVGTTPTVGVRFTADGGTGAGNQTVGLFRANRSGFGTVSLAIGNSNLTNQSSEVTFKGGVSLDPLFGVGVDYAKNGGDNFYIYDHQSTAVRMLVDSNGNVGIGTTAPGEALHVAGTIRADNEIHGDRICDETGNNCRDLSTPWSGGTVTSVGVSAPLQVTNPTTTPSISLPVATSSANGYLSSSDWSTFNAKLASNLPSGQIFVGNGSNTATGVAMSGDATISNTGILTIATNAIESSNISDGSITAAKLDGGVGVWSVSGGNIYRSSGNVAIGTSTPTAPLTVGGTGVIHANAYGSTPRLRLTRVNNTEASPTGITNGDPLGQILFTGYDTTTVLSAAGARIEATASENWSNTAAGTLMTFATRPNGSNSAATERMRIDQDGRVGIGTTTPSGKLHASSYQTATGGTVVGVRSDMTFSPVDAATTYALGTFNYLESQTGNANAIHQMEGSVNHVIHGSTGNLMNAYGSRNRIESAGTNASTITNAVGTYSVIDVQNSTRGISNATAFRAEVNNSGGGTIGLGYGLYVNDLNATTGYGIYQAGSNDANFFAGNLGIGTTTPSASLHVHNNAVAENWLQISNGTTGASTADGLQVGVLTNGSGYLWQVENADLIFATNDTERARILANGNVGIGITNPAVALHVNGAILGRAAIQDPDTVIDFLAGNTQYTTANCQAFTLHNLRDGGNYVFAVHGATSTTCSFTAYSGAGTGSLSVRMPTGHGPTIASTHTLYNFIVVGGFVYVSWSPGL